MGYNAMGAVGNGSTADALTSGPITLPAPVSTLRLGRGGSLNGQTLALLSDGTMWAWGADTCGQLRDGGRGFVTAAERVATPVPYVAVESCGDAWYGLDASGNLWGWGDNTRFQLGNGTTGTQLAPAVIATGGSERSLRQPPRWKF